MTAPFGESAGSGLDFDALLATPSPTFTLAEPRTAPPDMLARVRVNTEGRCLETDTPLGVIAVEMYWSAQDGQDNEAVRGDFFAPLTPDLDPGAAANPIATQHYPYTLLPDGARYGIAVRAPLAAAEAEWSEERQSSVAGIRVRWA